MAPLCIKSERLGEVFAFPPGTRLREALLLALLSERWSIAHRRCRGGAVSVLWVGRGAPAHRLKVRRDAVIAACYRHVALPRLECARFPA